MIRLTRRQASKGRFNTMNLAEGPCRATIPPCQRSQRGLTTLLKMEPN